MMEQHTADKAPRLSASTVKVPWAAVAEAMTLSFDNLSWATPKGETVLHSCTGTVTPGQVLAIMGPSGAGKTTLVNLLAGRTLPSAGEIRLNDLALNKRLRRSISYVMQNDILLANLTVRETLAYAALLRMPNTYSRAEKLERVDLLILELGLTKAINTRIGDDVVRGVSGGERKRVSIGIELLAEPAVIILDEPTSGLDSASAALLIESLRAIASNEQRTVLMTIHQPSSRMFAEFDQLLLLADGHTMYSGAASAALQHFEAAGLPCTEHYNPADFFLEVLVDPAVRSQILAYNGATGKSDAVRAAVPAIHASPKTAESNASLQGEESRWPTTFYQQFAILTARSFKQNRGALWTVVNFIQSFLVAFIVGGAWFQVGTDEGSIQDAAGYFFFTAAYWGFQSLFIATQTFPAERTVMMKERAAGTYRLSAYLLAKSVSELPLVMLQPTIYMLISYWMAGMAGGWRFLASLGYLLVYCVAAHSIGLSIGAIVMDGKRAAMSSTVVMLTSMIFGGFYVQNLPPGLDWLKYFSVVRYIYYSMLIFEFDEDTRYTCSLDASAFSSCAGLNQLYANGTDISGLDHDLITGDDILDKYNAKTDIVQHMLVLIAFLIVFRIATYYALKYLHSTKGK